MFKEFVSGVWGQIKAGKFDFWEILVPILIEGAKSIAQKVIDGKEINDTFVAVIKYAYYGTFLFYDLLVQNEDEEWTDEAIMAARSIFVDAATEGSFQLDIPDEQE